MTFSGPFMDETPPPLSDTHRAFLKRMQEVHRPDPANGLCHACQRRNCPEYRWARAELAIRAMMEPDPVHSIE